MIKWNSIFESYPEFFVDVLVIANGRITQAHALPPDSRYGFIECYSGNPPGDVTHWAQLEHVNGLTICDVQELIEYEEWLMSDDEGEPK